MSPRKVSLSLFIVVLVSMVLAGCGGGSNPISETTKYTLEITVDGLGTVLPESGEEYAEGTLVTLTPLPAENWVFASWGGANGSEVVGNKILMDSDKSITGLFSEDQSLYLGVTNLLEDLLAAIQTQNGLALEALFAPSFQFTDPEGSVSADPATFVGAVIVSPDYDSELPTDISVSSCTVSFENRSISSEGVVTGTIDFDLTASSDQAGMELSRSITGQTTLTLEQDSNENWLITDIDASDSEWSQTLVPNDAVDTVLAAVFGEIQLQTGDNAETVKNNIAGYLTADFRYTNPGDTLEYQAPTSLDEFASSFIIDKTDQDTPDDAVIESISLAYTSREYTTDNPGEITGIFDYELQASSVSEGLYFTDTVSGTALFTMANVSGQWKIQSVNLSACTAVEAYSSLPQ